MKQTDLWTEVANKCLSRALAILEANKTDGLFDSVEVQRLVQIAIAIDSLNLQWEQQNRYGAAVFRAPPFSPQAKGN